MESRRSYHARDKKPVSRSMTQEQLWEQNIRNKATRSLGLPIFFVPLSPTSSSDAPASGIRWSVSTVGNQMRLNYITSEELPTSQAVRGPRSPIAYHRPASIAGSPAGLVCLVNAATKRHFLLRFHGAMLPTVACTLSAAALNQGARDRACSLFLEPLSRQRGNARMRKEHCPAGNASLRLEFRSPQLRHYSVDEDLCFERRLPQPWHERRRVKGRSP